MIPTRLSSNPWTMAIEAVVFYGFICLSAIVPAVAMYVHSGSALWLAFGAFCFILWLAMIYDSVRFRQCMMGEC